MKYTVILKRSMWLLDIFDYEDADLYVANPDTDFASVQDACIAAKKEAAKADYGDVCGILAERGMGLRSKKIDPDHYQVYLVFEGQAKVVVSGPRDLLVLNLNDGFDG